MNFSFVIDTSFSPVTNPAVEFSSPVLFLRTVCQLQRSELGLPKPLLPAGPCAESSLVTIAGDQGRSETRG